MFGNRNLLLRILWGIYGRCHTMPGTNFTLPGVLYVCPNPPEKPLRYRLKQTVLVLVIFNRNSANNLIYLKLKFIYNYNLNFSIPLFCRDYLSYGHLNKAIFKRWHVFLSLLCTAYLHIIYGELLHALQEVSRLLSSNFLSTAVGCAFSQSGATGTPIRIVRVSKFLFHKKYMTTK